MSQKPIIIQSVPANDQLKFTGSVIIEGDVGRYASVKTENGSITVHGKMCDGSVAIAWNGSKPNTTLSDNYKFGKSIQVPTGFKPKNLDFTEEKVVPPEDFYQYNNRKTVHNPFLSASQNTKKTSEPGIEIRSSVGTLVTLVAIGDVKLHKSAGNSLMVKTLSKFEGVNTGERCNIFAKHVLLSGYFGKLSRMTANRANIGSTRLEAVVKANQITIQKAYVSFDPSELRQFINGQTVSIGSYCDPNGNLLDDKNHTFN